MHFSVCVTSVAHTFLFLGGEKMKLHFWKKALKFIAVVIAFSFVSIFIDMAINSDVFFPLSMILAFLTAPILVVMYCVLKSKQNKVFNKKMQDIGSLVGMNYADIIAKLDLGKPTTVSKDGEYTVYSWNFAGFKGNTGLSIAIDQNSVCADYQYDVKNLFS